MSRILVISQLPPPVHGSTVMTGQFLQTLDELGHEWRLVDRRFSTSVADVGVFTMRKVFSAAWMPLRLLAALVRFRPAVVVFFVTNRTFSFLVDWVLSEILRRFRLRRINYVHATGFAPLASRGSVWAWMVARVLRSADTTVHLGPALAPDIAQWVSESRIVFIPNTIPDHPLGLGGNALETRGTVLYLSNLIPEKGADTFVDLAIALADDFPHLEFLAAGAPTDIAFADSLLAKVDHAGLSSRIRLLGAVTDHDAKWNLLRSAAVFVFPSSYRFEAYPLVLAEALASGTPIASYRIGALAPTIDDADAGSVVAVGDRSGLEDAVRSLLTDRELAADMASRGRALYERELTPARFRQRWADLLDGGEPRA